MTVPVLLFVHAHPDDESLATGISIAHHAHLGHEVHVLTCTLGEEGEVIPDQLAHLENAPGDPLAAHRRGELGEALAALGATGHLLGGAAPAYRDSGMAGSATATDPRAFAAAEVDEVAARIRTVIEDVRPDAVVTYDRSGGYGHPDHVQAHRATLAAVAAMPSPPATYVVLTPRSWAREDRDWVIDRLGGRGLDLPEPDAPYPTSVVPDTLVSHATVCAECVPRQAAALRAHATQVAVHDGWYTLSNAVPARLTGREGFARIDPRTAELIAAPRGERRGLLDGIAS